MDENTCPECGGKIERDESGERVCSNCGLVTTEKPHIGLDKEDEQTEDTLEQVLNQDTEKLGSVIDGAGPEDWEGVEHQGKYRRLKWLQERTSRDKTIDDKVDRIKGMCAVHNIPEIICKSAIGLAKKAVEKGLTRSYNTEDFIAALIYTSYKQNNMPCTPYDMCLMIRGDPNRIPGNAEKKLNRLHAVLKRGLGLKIMPAKPEDYIPKYCSALKLSQDVQKKANDIISWAYENKINYNSPSAAAATAVYVASWLCNEPTNQDKIDKISGVTKVTIRKLTKKFSGYIEINLGKLK